MLNNIDKIYIFFALGNELPLNSVSVLNILSSNNGLKTPCRLISSTIKPSLQRATG